jgi:hypothetical protein
MKNIIPPLVTAGGKIVCVRCAAKSKRSGEQCKKPAMRGKAVCDFHGGRSTGPKTQAGKDRQRAAVTKTGEFSKAEVERADRRRALMAILEDAIHLLQMALSDAPKTPGRKPKLHIPVTCPEDVLRSILVFHD